MHARGCGLAWPEREVPYLCGSPENPWAVACMRVLVVPAVHDCLVAVLACLGPHHLHGVSISYLILSYHIRCPGSHGLRSAVVEAPRDCFYRPTRMPWYRPATQGRICP